ncbi:hypothetical protein NQZ68_000810 [Dissostichus eleginoides]|nr:hypothetical protein NQZ68_000810 [Dissostichus eleginoides]
MNKNHRVPSNRSLSAVEVKSKFGAEFRRFSLDRSKPGRFDEFYGLLQHVHRIPNVELLVGYADVHGDLLPINNDDNYHKAISVASPLLRLFLQRTEPEAEGRTKPGSPPARPSPVKSLFRRVSDRLVRIDLGTPGPRSCSSLPSTPPSSPTSSPSSPLSSWRLHIAGLRRRLGLSDPDLATSSQPPPCYPVLRRTSQNDPPLTPHPPCPKLMSSLSPRHVPTSVHTPHADS